MSGQKIYNEQGISDADQAKVLREINEILKRGHSGRHKSAYALVE
jgi:hypothetical protein